MQSKVEMEIRLSQFGTIADGKTLDTETIQNAIDSVANVGGGTVVFDGGHSFLSGSLVIKKGVELHLEAGARLIASSDYDHYLPEHSIPKLTSNLVSETVLPRRAFIAGYQAHGCSITGPGQISGNSEGFIEARGEYIHVMKGPVGGKSQYLERPFTIFLIDSQEVKFHDFTLTDPAFWAIRLTGCNDSSIQKIRILTDLKVPNADGIDIDRCQRVDISDCELVTADDCISLKSCAGTSVFGDVSEIQISRCDMVSTSAAITLGTESVGAIRNVIVQDCIVRDTHRGFAVRAREGGLISQVVFKDSQVSTRAFSPDWWGHGEALHVTAFRWNEPENIGEGNSERGLFGNVRDIRFENLRVTSEAGTLVWGQVDGLIDEISFSNVYQVMRRESEWEPRVDLRPNDVQPVVRRPHNAFELVNAGTLSFSHVEVLFDGDRDWFGELIFKANCRLVGSPEEVGGESIEDNED